MHRQTDRQTDTDRQRQGDRERQTDIDRDGETETGTDRQRKSETEKNIGKQREIETERQRQRDTQRRGREEKSAQNAHQCPRQPPIYLPTRDQTHARTLSGAVCHFGAIRPP